MAFGEARLEWSASWLFLLVLTACGDDGPTDPPPATMSAAAANYLRVALDIMEEHSINRYVIDWPVFRQNAIDRAGVAQTTTQTYPAIEFALEALGDNHSFFRPPAAGALAATAGSAGAASLASAAAAQVVDPTAQLLDGGLGYVRVPAFGGSGAEGNALADEYHRLIQGVETQGTCGWVVDLRHNTGGNMWPMVAGVGPILGEGVLGFFVDPDSIVDTWTYEDGGAYLDGVRLAFADPAFGPISPAPPVAVLTDERTASSGEATAVAFRARPDTRSFGTATFGVSTANRGFELSDGAWIFLTVSTMADRSGRLYGVEIEPDDEVAGQLTGDPATDAVLARAMEWLGAQPACAA